MSKFTITITNKYDVDSRYIGNHDSTDMEHAAIYYGEPMSHEVAWYERPDVEFVDDSVE